MDTRTTMAEDEIRRKASEWKGLRAAGSPETVQQFVDDVRAEILTQRTAF